ncbi:sodium/calcium exchanger Calx-like [Haliotis cracherodii]|uniref:sodium/calcium exchanger Calx-like n=1 Tax=Haliotis cracherodii TaxID=6455 RepID=UPI0039ED389F
MKVFCIYLVAAIVAARADPPGGDDGRVFLHTEPYEVNEEPNAVARVRIDREGPTDRRTTVNYTLLPDTATAGHDFNGRPGSITFEVDETTHYISIPIIDDDEMESNEMFEVCLDGADNALLGATTCVAMYIIDDELKAYLEAARH